jgi:hypothetical protein
VECVDDNFVSAVMRNVWVEANSFDELWGFATRTNLYWWSFTFDSKERIETIQPTVFLISIPFPGICTVLSISAMDVPSWN